MSDIDFNVRASRAIELIKRAEKLALAMHSDIGFYVGMSGGKDSQVLLDLVKLSGVKYRAFYHVTGIDPPENVYFIRKFYPDVEFIHPPLNFFQIVEKYGMPTINRRSCCRIIKEQVGAGFCVLTGVRAEESSKRAGYHNVDIVSRRKEHADKSVHRSLDDIYANNHQCIKGKDRVMVYPLLDWSDGDIWSWIIKRGLPVNPCYQKFHRVGCMYCPFAAKYQLAFYEREYPRYRKLLRKCLDRHFEDRSLGNFRDVSEYYDWWRSGLSFEAYQTKRYKLGLPLLSEPL